MEIIVFKIPPGGGEQNHIYPMAFYVISRGSLRAMFKIKEAAMGSVAGHGGIDQ